MQRERRSVASHLENQAQTEREHLEMVEQVSNARMFLNLSNRVRNSRMAVGSLLAGLGILVAIDITADEHIPEELQIAMDVSQVAISGALIGSAVRPVSRVVDGVLSIYDETHMNRSFNAVSVEEQSGIRIGDDSENANDWQKIQNIRKELSRFGRDLSKDFIPKRNIGDPTGNEHVDAIRSSIALKLSHERELPILTAGTVEAYIERGQVSSEKREDPRLKILDHMAEKLTTEDDQKIGKRREHSDFLDGIVMLFMESQVLSESMKRKSISIQKRAAVITGDFLVGIGSMTALVVGASSAVGPDYKGLAYFADDAASLVGIGLAPAFKRLLSTQTAFELRSYAGDQISNLKGRIVNRFGGPTRQK